ncbi:hypothetical protein ACIBCR_15595 [Micromonospora echinospora]|uniref:hypothetical protein n=1 Tax=Micromonospora echinospora TaxID=1877 RepID=UPI0037BA443E
MTPTPAQRRELLAAIENDGKVQPRAGAGAARLRAALLVNGWVKGGYVTDAGRQAVNENARS